MKTLDLRLLRLRYKLGYVIATKLIKEDVICMSMFTMARYPVFYKLLLQSYIFYFFLVKNGNKSLRPDAALQT